MSPKSSLSTKAGSSTKASRGRSSTTRTTPGRRPGRHSTSKPTRWPADVGPSRRGIPSSRLAPLSSPEPVARWPESETPEPEDDAIMLFADEAQAVKAMQVCVMVPRLSKAERNTYWPQSSLSGLHRSSSPSFVQRSSSSLPVSYPQRKAKFVDLQSKMMEYDLDERVVYAGPSTSKAGPGAKPPAVIIDNDEEEEAEVVLLLEMESINDENGESHADVDEGDVDAEANTDTDGEEPNARGRGTIVSRYPTRPDGEEIYCHQCRLKSRLVYMHCRSSKCTQGRGRTLKGRIYCKRCIVRAFGVWLVDVG
ncbi:hypothetical protein BDZ89DRAFT_1144778 [Hymenopellis radicata]|nr:hypothetical protein BDZ89DRAFT_1144778 [Hymenopellis radicata]